MRKVINEYEINENGAPKEQPQKTRQTPNEQEHGATVTTTVGCLRGMMFAGMGIMLSVSGAIAVWSQAGFLMGLFAGLVLLVLSIGFTIYWTTTVKQLTIWDCLLPLPLGLVSSVLFAPASLLFNLSVFSALTCMGAALFLSMTMLLYRSRKIDGKWLIFPFLVFMYEMLPVEFPGELDNMLSFGGNIVNTIAALSFSPINQLRETQAELPDSSEDEKGN